ncbi:MAG: GNAT family N-acetyltransferase [Patescibacteria group bacterium]
MSYIIGEYPSERRKMTKGEIDQIVALYRQLFEQHQERAEAINYNWFDLMLEANHLWLAQKDEAIVSMGFLIPNQKPIITETFGGIHDIVTDKEHRGKVQNGQSLAEIILKKMIEFAKLHRFKYLELTSAPSRAAANRLYQNLGFRPIAHANMGERGATNLYRLYL